MKFVVTNVYVGNRQLDTYAKSVVASKPHVLFVSEAFHLGALKGYKKYTGGTGDSALFVKDRLAKHVVSWKAHKATSEAGHNGNVRTIIEVRIEKSNMKIALFSVHANPYRHGEHHDENVKLINLLISLTEKARADGYLIAAGGDWNRRPDEPGKDSPTFYAKRCDLQAWHPHIDGIFISKELKFDNQETVRFPGSDHPGYTGRFVKKSIIKKWFNK